MTDYYSALLLCADRYDEMLLDFMSDSDYWGWSRSASSRQEHVELRKFIGGEFKQGCVDGLPLNKLNRWLGYIQGTLIAWHLTTVEAERNWTRPLFRPLDFGAPDGC